MAGITAAHELTKNGISVTVIEAGSYIGGRIKSFQFHESTYELGANWIHGLKNEEN